MAYRKSPPLFPTAPFPTPYAPPFPRLEVHNPHPELQQLLLSPERVKLRTSNLASTFTGPSEQKYIKDFGEKGTWAYQAIAQFLGCPLLSQEQVKLRTSNFVRTFIGSIGTKAH